MMTFRIWSIGENICAFWRRRGRGVFVAIQSRQRLAGEYEHRGLMAELHDKAVGFDDLVGRRRGGW